MIRAAVFSMVLFLLMPGCQKESRGVRNTATDTLAKGGGGGGQLFTYSPPRAVGDRPTATESAVSKTAEAEALSSESKIIKTAQLEFEVKNIQESKKRISDLVAAEKGYIANQEEANNRREIRVHFIIRVPADGFDRLVESILKEGIYVGNSRIERRDVTEEFLDLKARMETQKALEARYRDILRQAKNVEDILKVESELGALRQEIEAKEGRMKYLAHQAEYSTINAEAYQSIPYTAPPRGEGESFVDRLASSLVDGWSGLVTFSLGLMTIWPVIVLGVLCYLIFRRFRRQRHKAIRKKESDATVTNS